MKYVFIDDKLILEGMMVNTKNPPKINGVEPESGNDIFDYYYKDLNLKTEFTGSVLLAKDFIGHMYVHMGFQRPMAFETVIEIQVENGDILVEIDLSRKMEDFRDRDSSEGARPKSDSDGDIMNWINSSFSLDYDF